MDSSLTTIFKHNLWANLRLLDLCAGLSEELLNARATGTYGRLCDTLLHILACEEIYVNLLTGREPVHTLGEGAGFPGFEELTWHALLVPAGTPQAIVKQLYAATAKVLRVPNVQQAMLRLGLEIESSTPQELATRIKSETALWSTLIKETGIRVE